MEEKQRIMECSICLDPFMASKMKERAISGEPVEDQVISLECGHVYHEKCVNEWLKSNESCHSCPSCRHDIDNSQFRKIFLDSIVGAPRPPEKCKKCPELEEEVEDLKEEKNLLSAQVESFEDCEQKYKEKIEYLTVQIESLKMSLLDTSKEKSYQETIQDLTNQVESLRKQNELLVANQQSDKEEIQSLTNQNQDLRNTNEAAQAQIVTLSESKALANKETEDLKEKIEILGAQKESLLESLRWNLEKNQDLIARVAKWR